MRSRSSGTSGRCREGNTTGSRTWALSTRTTPAPSNGGRPGRREEATAPRAERAPRGASARALERRAAGQEEVGDGPQRVEVAARVERRVALRLLGSHVLRRAAERPLLPQLG